MPFIYLGRRTTLHVVVRHMHPHGQIWRPGKYTHHNVTCYGVNKFELRAIMPLQTDVWSKFATKVTKNVHTYSKLKALKRTNISNLFFYCCFQLLKSYKNKTNTIKIISRDNFKIKASEYVNYSRKFNTYLKEEVNLLINLSKTAQPTSPTFSYEIMT